LRFSVLNDAVDIDLALSMLHKEVEAKLLANPRVLVLDNETANFEIVREVPYRELLQVAREDPITYTEFKDVGVQLKVTPHIARDGMIRLHIVPEFGVLVAQGALRASTGWDFYQDALGVPTVDTRRADTTAMIKDGQTIVIGGLRKRRATKDISKVPLLADLPLLGGLFKSETESVEINELVVFITTTIVTEPVLSEIEEKQYSQTEFVSPEITKLRLEREGRPKTEVDEDKDSITELLDLLLKKLESSTR
jgi:type II secretory pathway component GspD/PulD (secretin)